ncbi:ArnT family glycosyltransferase [Rhodopirellula sp. MGV]|uniref:ArnT family glycosyltransferase n=1 Tax=Rhodopirellula sp. MGV TaxID=2023130 RepID=UPI00130458C8|nr:phospholipid carrier-dependent glycosyltransferase [Rhodopirellula sp. MGV]
MAARIVVNQSPFAVADSAGQPVVIPYAPASISLDFLRHHRYLLLSIVACLLVRGGGLFVNSNRFVEDPDAYQAIASTISNHGVFGLTSPQNVPRAIAFRPPLYPWLLSWIVVDDATNGSRVSPVLLGIFHTCLGCLTVWLVFLFARDTARRIRNVSPRSADVVASIAALIFIFDPILLRQSIDAMTETLAATLAMAVIYCWYRWSIASHTKTQLAWSVLLGTSLALGYLCRPTFLVWSVFLCGAMLLNIRERRLLPQLALTAGIIVIAVAGWTIRNQRVTGHPVWATTHGGYTLLLGNNESFYDYLADNTFGEAWDATRFINAYQHRYEGDPLTAEFWSKDWQGPVTTAVSASEYEDDRLVYQSAVETIKRRPSLFVWASIVRVARLWSPLPHEVQGRSLVAILGVGIFYLMLGVAVLIAIARHWKSLIDQRFWAIGLLAFTLSGVHAVYWSNMRMRAPIMPAIACLAVLAFPRGRDLPE